MAEMIVMYLVWKTWKKRRDQKAEEKRQRDNLEIPFFNFDAIASATNNFSCANKLGEGGFGPVYYGELSTGQEIAVKRLSQKSGQGINEFRNEVILIAKLQHRNLVRLLGYCIKKEEKMLIYEYMPNSSLDTFLFVKKHVTQLGKARQRHNRHSSWTHLHKYSRLRVIHRDLKASNILLDSEMNPKISDFGMARTFGDDQKEAETTTIVGTYGYMSPEYAKDGLFSMKSDVFSFGVLVLELVSGKKNRGFCHPGHNLTLLGHAWELWNASKGLELVDKLMEDSIVESEVLRVIQAGLLCVQQHPKDRPNISSVILMLSSDGEILQNPKQPGFYTERRLSTETDSSMTDSRFSSLNDLSVTVLEAR